MGSQTTFHGALQSLQQSGPGAVCEDCGHFAYRHDGRMCLFPRKTERCICKGMKWKGQRIDMSVYGPVDTPSITCPVCDMTSYNPHDVEMGYCGNCHGYTGVVDPMMKARQIVAKAAIPEPTMDDDYYPDEKTW